MVPLRKKVLQSKGAQGLNVQDHVDHREVDDGIFEDDPHWPKTQ